MGFLSVCREEGSAYAESGPGIQTLLLVPGAAKDALTVVNPHLRGEDRLW